MGIFDFLSLKRKKNKEVESRSEPSNVNNLNSPRAESSSVSQSTESSPSSNTPDVVNMSQNSAAQAITEKHNQDLEKLLAFEKKINSSTLNSSPSSGNNLSEIDPDQERFKSALRIRNPFRGV